jgi:hypothetical protein
MASGDLAQTPSALAIQYGSCESYFVGFSLVGVGDQINGVSIWRFFILNNLAQNHFFLSYPRSDRHVYMKPYASQYVSATDLHLLCQMAR